MLAATTFYKSRVQPSGETASLPISYAHASLPYFVTVSVSQSVHPSNIHTRINNRRNSIQLCRLSHANTSNINSRGVNDVGKEIHPHLHGNSALTSAPLQTHSQRHLRPEIHATSLTFGCGPLLLRHDAIVTVLLSQTVFVWDNGYSCF